MADTTVNNGTGLNVVALNDMPVKGMAAVDALAVGLLPVFIGGEVAGGLAQAPLIADAHVQRVRLSGDGRVLTCPIAPPEDHGISTPVALANDTSAHALIAAQAPSIKIALWGVDIVNLSGNITSVIWTDAVSSVVLGRLFIPIGGVSVTWPVPIKTGAASALNYTLTTLPGGINLVFVTPHWVITRA